MRARLFQFSSVIVGQTHNPTILNPNFLEIEGVVPKSWAWKVADTITTPPFAMVRYENGISVTVEQAKLQVSDPNVENGPEKSKVTEIASAYVRTLPHVHYMSVGNNFQSLLQIDTPETFLKRLLLKNGPWDNSKRKLDAIAVRFMYPLNPGILTLSIDVGEAQLPDDADKQSVVLTNANFGRECTKHPAHEEVCELLSKASSDWAVYEDLLQEILLNG